MTYTNYTFEGYDEDDELEGGDWVTIGGVQHWLPDGVHLRDLYRRLVDERYSTPAWWPTQQEKVPAEVINPADRMTGWRRLTAALAEADEVSARLRKESAA